jgi:hypothetical protein
MTMANRERSGQSCNRSVALLLIFLLLFLLGIALGEPARVLEQARSICLECIGIG